MKQPNQPSDFLLVADVAKALAVTPAMVRVLERTGKLPAIRSSGGVRLFRREDVDQLLVVRKERVRK